MESFGIFWCIRRSLLPKSRISWGSSWRPKSCQWWPSPPMHVCAWLDLWLAAWHIFPFFLHGNFDQRVYERSHYKNQAVVKIYVVLKAGWFMLVLHSCFYWFAETLLTLYVSFQANLWVTIRQISKKDKETWSINHNLFLNKGGPLHHWEWCAKSWCANQASVWSA